MDAASSQSVDSRKTKNRILSLDGGGAKGVYTLGFLSRLEAEMGSPLSNHFHLIYGTSTGSIIASQLSLGRSVQNIYENYLENIPRILGRWSAKKRSKSLRATVHSILDGASYSDFKVPTGLVSTNWDDKRPLIFKSHSALAHSGSKTFIPGFGVELTDAICACCSAVPLFKPVEVIIQNQGSRSTLAYDGGFCANNPSAFAMIDAEALNFQPDNSVLISVGVGHYPKPGQLTLPRIAMKLAGILPTVRMLSDVLETSSNTSGIIEKLAYKNFQRFRADETFSAPELGADLLECNRSKLRKLFARGTETFAQRETEITSLL